MSEVKSTNLPAHLQEKMDEAACSYDGPIHFNCYGCCQSDSDYVKAFKAGYQQAYFDLIAELGPVLEAISFYADMDSWSENKQKESIYDVIDKDDLGVGDFEQSCGPNHVLNSVSDSNNGGRRAREALKHLKERILNEQ